MPRCLMQSRRNSQAWGKSVETIAGSLINSRMKLSTASAESQYPKGFKVMLKGPNKISILFLCTGNSCRSQMAEGWARHLRGDRIDAWSAGTEPHGMDPRAVKVMAEAGVDISAQVSKHVNSLGDLAFDFVITLCEGARESCPVFPAKNKVLHAGFDDPPRLAAGAASEEAASVSLPAGS